MYLLWYDDNAATNPDGFYTIDDFAISSVVTGAAPCPGITNSPASLTVTQCLVSSVAFSVGATGAVAGIQWERNSGGGFAAIPGANGSTYTLTPVGVGDSGSQFRAIVSGGVPCSPLTSGAATLTVIADTTGPIPLYALGNANLTNITVVFNELINTNVPGTSEVIGNYTLMDTNTAVAVVLLTAIPLANGRGYLLETDPLNPSHGYEIILSATRDACADNTMIDVTIPVYTYISQPLSITAPWKFLQNVVDPGASWFSIGFNDSAWATANGPFDMKRDGNYPVAPTHCRSNTFYGLQGPVPTCLSMTNPVTGATNMVVYFRTHFNYSGNTNQTFLEFSGKADDGWVTYLNGVELVRFGVAAAPAVITGTSPTTRTVGDGEGRDTALFNATPALRNGDNLVSVILLQQSTTSSDLTMGLEFRAFTLAQLCAAGSLSIVQVGANVTVTWSGGAVLQQSTDISSPANWSNVPGSPSSPFTTTASGAAKFYRVVCP